MKKTFILISILIFAVFGCKKDSDLTRSELISRIWKISSVILNGTADNTTNYSSYRLEFKSDGTYVFSNAITPTIPNTGKWELADNEQSLLLNKGASSEQKGIIQQISSNNFDVQFTYKNYKNGDVTVLFKLVPGQ